MGRVYDNDICVCSMCVIVIPSYVSQETLKNLILLCKGVTKRIEICISVDELRAIYVR